MAVAPNSNSFAAGSRDTLTLYCTDVVYNAETERNEETEIDLTDKVVELYYTITLDDVEGARVGPKSVTRRLPQEGDDLGRADYQWGDAELTAGELKAEVVITDAGALPHKPPDVFCLTIRESMV